MSRDRARPYSIPLERVALFEASARLARDVDIPVDVVAVDDRSWRVVDMSDELRAAGVACGICAFNSDGVGYSALYVIR